MDAPLCYNNGAFFLQSPQPYRLQQMAFFLRAHLLSAFTGHYLLRSRSYHLYWVQLPFSVMFWLVLLFVKAQTYERI